MLRKGRTAVNIARTKGVKASLDVAVEVARNQAIVRSRKAAAPVTGLALGNNLYASRSN